MTSSSTENQTKSWPVFPINVLGLFCFLILLEGFKIQNHCSRFSATIYLLLAIAIPIVVAEALVLKSYRHKDTGLDFKTSTQADNRRVLVKILGLYLSMGFVGLLYFIFPEYRKSSYHPYWILLQYLAPIICIAAIPYIYVLDKYLIEKEDGNWHAGMFFLGQLDRIDRNILKNHFLGWLVKGFFLALMFTYLVGNISHFQIHSIFEDFLNAFTRSPDDFYRSMIKLIFTIDLAYVSVGYILTLKIFNSHIRSVEPTVLGWLAALACYQPFWDFFYNGYLGYNNDNFNFDNWLGGSPAILISWASAILILLIIYVWATLQFGIRFSNLTHRGIITNGPYGYCKHPAYVSKNISWWLISVPFISASGPVEAIKSCLLLVCVNLIYYLRAKTEEAHLAKDKAYRAYLDYMDKHSLYSRLRQRFIS